MAKYVSDNGLLYVWQKIKAMFVQKEEGKGLSSNDYTTAEKNKLTGIETNANKTTVTDNLTSTSAVNALSANMGKKLNDEKVDKIAGKGLSTNDLTDELVTKIMNAGDSTFSGNYDDLTNKPFIPTKTSDLTNDAEFQTAAQVATAVNAAGHLKRVIVQELPDVAAADVHTIYMLEEESTGTNRYTEWLVIDGAWEQIGSTDVDLSEYIKAADLVPITNAEIDNIISTVFS